MPSRRNFLRIWGVSSLVLVAARQNAFGLTARGEGEEWAKEIRKACERLLAKNIMPGQWQNEIDRIYRTYDVGVIRTGLDFEAIQKGMKIEDNHGHWLKVVTPGLSLDQDKVKIETKIVGIKQGRSVPPHGHENQVSAFLTLQGEFHLRQWERLERAMDYLDIKPHFDGLTKPGEWNSQSEERTNIHWLTAKSPESYFLSVLVTKIDGTSRGQGRIPIDPEGAKEIRPGVFGARVMEKDSWWGKYR